MPTYEYECNDCGNVMELFQQITDPAKKKMDCPACGKLRPVTRLIGAGGSLIFKGSGFYQTDYRSSAYHSAAKSEKSGGHGESKATASETKAEKPAAKTETTPKSKPKGEKKSS